jgi:hypothetical protein
MSATEREVLAGPASLVLSAPYGRVMRPYGRVYGRVRSHELPVKSGVRTGGRVKYPEGHPPCSHSHSYSYPSPVRITRKHSRYPGILSALCAILLAGCETFSDYDPRPPLDTREEFKIEQAVYAYLLSQDFWSERNYSAVFLKGSDEEVAAMISRFPKHVPPLKPSTAADVQPNRTPLDKETGKPGVILSATVSEPKDNQAEAIGNYYGGALYSGMYVFELKRVEGEWRIESVTKR